MWVVFLLLLLLCPLSVQAEYLGDLSANPYAPTRHPIPTEPAVPSSLTASTIPTVPTAVRSATNPRRILSPPTRHGSMTSKEIIVAR